MPKIMCTNRIRISSDKVIYCSGDIIREIRELITRLNQMWHPLKGEMYSVQQRLALLSRQEKYELHFPKSSHRILDTIGRF